MTAANSQGADIEQVAGSAPSALALSKLRARHRYRITRSAVGLAAVAWALHVAYRHYVLAVSLDALVTSEVISVSAPIEGYLERSAFDAGALVEQGATLATISNPLADTTHLAEIKARLASLDGELGSVQWTIARLDALGKTFAHRGAGFQARRTQQLNIVALQAEGTLSTSQARLLEAESRLKRTEEMVREGTSSTQEGEAAQRDFAVARDAVGISKQQLENARLAKDAQSEGYSLTDFSSTDKSYSEQKQDEVSFNLTRLNADLSFKRSMREALTAELQAEQADYERHARAFLKAEQRSRILSVGAGNGVFVARGSNLYKILDCSRLRVTAYVSERAYSRLRVGDVAQIDVASDKSVYMGRVTLLLGPPELRTSGEFAAALPKDLRERYTVVVESSELSHQHSPGCAAGQAAEVTFHPSGRLW